jgi:hypothetical protein
VNFIEKKYLPTSKYSQLTVPSLFVVGGGGAMLEI